MSADLVATGQAGSTRAGSGTLAAFTLAIFTSAFLLFAIQPMFAKMVLPQLGGSPAVWSVAMVVFQALLLAGYAYAHALTRYFSPRGGAGLHLVLLCATALTLPIAVSGALGTPPEEGQALWLVGLFLVSVGLPFFAVAGNGPLLQAWFARSGHAQAADPYFLYGASNLGSFSALLLYPVLFEPLLSVRAQTAGWSLGFLGLITFIALAAFTLRHVPGIAQAAPAAATPRPRLRTVLGWVALSFIPSGLLVAVTAHISTDVAAAPFLWVMPLALFLLTFVLIFRDQPLLPMGLVYRALPVLAGAVVLFAYIGTGLFLATLAVHILFFFVATLVCHDRLYRARPEAAHLTAFYLWMSVGGVLGGLFAGLIAPLVFNRVIEYPILVVLSLLAIPALGTMGWRAALRQAAPVLVVGAVVLGYLVLAHGLPGLPAPAWARAGLLGLICLCVVFNARPAMMLAAVPLLFASVDTVQLAQAPRFFDRSFFGVHKVELREGGQFRVLAHGTTIHGAMRVLQPDGAAYTGPAKPLMYYHPEGGMAATLAAVPTQVSPRKIGIVGLGTGAHACNGRKEDHWSFFEIDAAVVHLARDATRFRFLAECAPEARIVLGDARLTLAREPAGGFDYLLIDAFSSDAIPMHLLTREALALYTSRLAPNGMLALHITNRHLELESVVAALAREAGLVGRVRFDTAHPSGSMEDRVSSRVVALARSEATLAALTPQAGWKPLSARKVEPWSDDYSNIISALWRHYAP